MEESFNCDTVTLHVRESNRAAIGLYQYKLGYENEGLEKEYYADLENAIKMKK